MKFRVEHSFEIDPAAYEKLYFDEPFNEALCEAVDLERHLVKLDESDGKLVREVRVSPRGRQIPGPVAKLLGGKRIEYLERIQYTMGSMSGTWDSESSLMSDKIDSRGTFAFEGADGRTRRVVEGEIKVKIFGLGKTIEQFIVDDVKKSYDAAAEFTTKWLAKEKGAG